MRHDCDVGPEDLGPFLLDQLAPDESAHVAAAVGRCPVCRAEVAALEPVVAALATAAARPTPPPAVAARPAEARLDQLLDAVHAERRARRPRWLVAAAAAVAAVLLAVTGVLLATRDDDGGRRVELAGAGVTGWAVLAPDARGTRIDLEVSGLPAGHAYGVWLEDARGARVPAGSFRPAPDGETHLVLNAGLPLELSRAIGVTQLGGDDLVRRDLAGPTSTPG